MYLLAGKEKMWDDSRENVAGFAKIKALQGKVKVAFPLLCFAFPKLLGVEIKGKLERQSGQSLARLINNGPIKSSKLSFTNQQPLY
jgi:hypothetical protein